MRSKGASQLQREPRAPRAATGVRGASEARSAATPREHWTGPPEVREGPGADGPFRTGVGTVGSDTRMFCGRRIESDRVRPRRFAVKTEEQKLWSSTAQ